MPRQSRSGWSARAIAASIERSVHDGRVQPADALPPVRDLASKLRVSPATVAAAYRLLRSRGLTAADGRRGTRVIPRALSREAAMTREAPHGLVDLAGGNPDPDLLPSLAGAVRALDTEPAMYDRPPHLPALLSFARGEFEADAVAASALTLVNGALDAAERALREHLRPGDRVAVEDPSFFGVHDLVVAAGYVPVPFAVDDEGAIAASLDEALRRQCRAVIVTARAQNPRGSAMSPGRGTELRPLLRRYPDALLLETDPCGPVAGVPLVTLADAARARWVHIKSTAKFLGPDLRVAVVAGDSLTVNRMQARFAAGPRRVSHLLQQLVLTLWSDPSAGRQLARASEIYASRRRACLDALESRGIPAHGTSGFNIWVPLRHEAATVHALAERGWAVAGGEPFRLKSPPGIRVTTATLHPDDANRFAGDLAEALTAGGRPWA